MPRPRTRSDSDLLDQAMSLMRRHGPGGVTFAALGQATGLAPATLVQRFGCKAELLRAVLHRAWDNLDARTVELDAALPVSPEGAIRLLAGLSVGYGSVDTFAEGLLVLREDMRDPELRARGRRWGETLATMLGHRLADASGPRPDLGRLMASQWQGALLWWGFQPDGPPEAAVTIALRDWCAALGRPLDATSAGRC